MYKIYEQLLQKHGVTTYKVCQETGVSQSVISAWKNGKSVPNRASLQLIADFFDVSIDYLLRGEEVPQYYLNAETVTIAKEIFKDPNLRILFDAGRGAKPEDLKMAAEMLRRLKQTNLDG